MADTFTTNLNLTKPELGAAEDTWGISLNADLDSLDAIFSTSGTQINLNPNQINFADNKKAIFGAGSDLQIYHDGSHSYIDNVGSGSLIIQDTDGTGDIYIKPKSGQTAIAIYNDNTVQISHSGNIKLSTTSTGIDVTGTATMDGLTVDGQETINKNYAFGASNYHIKLGEDTSDSYIGNVNGSVFMATGTYYGSQQYTLTGGATALSGIYADGSSGLQFFSEAGLTANSTNTRKQRMNIANNGDISFYDDTGTSASLFWDAKDWGLVL